MDPREELTKKLNEIALMIPCCAGSDDWKKIKETAKMAALAMRGDGSTIDTLVRELGTRAEETEETAKPKDGTIQRKSRPPLCPCKETCSPLWNGLADDSRLKTGDLNEGYSGDCVGKSKPLEYVVGGQVHINDMNQCIFTPLKGVIRFQIEKGDIEAMLMMCKAVLHEIDPLNCEHCGAGRRFAHYIMGKDGKRLCCNCRREMLKEGLSDAEELLTQIMDSGQRNPETHYAHCAGELIPSIRKLLEDG